MNTEKESLKAHKAEILKSLKPEFQQDFLNQIEGLPDNDPQILTGDAEIAAIRAELKANPSVDENASAAELKVIILPKPIVPATDAELAAEKADLLSKANDMAKQTAKRIDAENKAAEGVDKAVRDVEKSISDAIDKISHPFG